MREYPCDVRQAYSSYINALNCEVSRSSARLITMITRRLS